MQSSYIKLCGQSGACVFAGFRTSFVFSCIYAGFQVYSHIFRMIGSGNLPNQHTEVSQMSEYASMACARQPPDHEGYPVWFDGKKINEVLFCEEFQQDRPMLCIHDTFFTTEGRVTDETMLKREILERIKPYVTSGVARRAANLLDALRVECWSPPLPVHQDRIHVAKGTLFLDGTFSREKDFCVNRLPVNYVPDAPPPEKWLAFLNELLSSSDILTLQEFIGYCLIPSTKRQRMLIITGRGGEGKSRIGPVMRQQHEYRQHCQGGDKSLCPR